MTLADYPSHSADVALWLECGEFGKLDLHWVSRSRVAARKPRFIPPCDAVLVVSIDGAEHRMLVTIPGGFSASKRTATVLTRDGIAPF